MLLEIGDGGVSGTIVSHGVEIPLERVGAVYARPLDLPARWSDGLARQRAEVFHELFLEWLDATPALVLNRPLSMESNSSKPYQQQEIRAAGFAVPETLVTSDPDEARAFWASHGRVIYKSVSGIRSIVRELDDVAARRLDRLRDLPVQLQAYVAGTDVRVHVVGGATFACEVASRAIDYRYAAREGLDADLSPTELPEQVREGCRALATRLGLPFCGVDLRRTPEGTWVCFEVNPMPAYSYFEIGSGLPIARAVVELLASGSPAGGERRWSRESTT
jgi:glutathione synthase/RimK-type ligase-like ATP-grasp enzyme